MMKLTKYFGLLTLYGSLFWASPAKTQNFNRIDETISNITSYYYYTQPGIATVQVYVMGTVREPGLYEISDGTDLGQLLALAGGPVLNARFAQDKQEAIIRLFRPASFSADPIYETELNRAITRQEVYPVLREGDVLTVEIIQHRRFGWRDSVSILGSLASVAIIVERIISR